MNEDTAKRRQRGLEAMRAAYGWEVEDGPGDFFAITADHLFGEIWTRPGLTNRDRRLLLIGLLVGQGIDDVLGLQLDASLRIGELSPDELREIALFLTHYAGWPRGTKLVSQVDALIAQHEKT